MKIIIVLSSLAIISSAVPTIHQESIHERESVFNNIPATLKREKKSSLDDHAAGTSSEAGTIEQTHGSSKSGPRMSSMEGRNIGFKKPIIIKKKIGYHLYRDSDEEMAHADPHENCRKQVKVKLCDDEPGSPKDMLNCFTSERINEEISEKEIENSIKTAKEAVENLQRGLHKIEHSAKMSNEDRELNDDFEVHQHIEAARKALEHVQQNFGNLETTNMQSSAPKPEDFQPKLSDEERLAQWKDAIDSIQKNFEIARNIEDAFRVESDKTDLLSSEINDTPKIKDSEHIPSKIDLQKTPNIANLGDEKSGENEANSLKKQREDFSEIFISPMEDKELKIKLHSDSLKSEKVSTHDDILKSNKITEQSKVNSNTSPMNMEKINSHSPMMKSSQLVMENTKPENNHEVHDHIHKQEFKAANDMNLGMLQVNEKEKEDSSTLNIKLETEKNALSEGEDMNQLLKEITNLRPTDASENMAKFANTDITMTPDKIGQDMSVESSNVIAQQQSHLETKSSLDNDRENLMKGDTINEFDNLQIDKHHNAENLMLLKKDNHNLHERVIHEITTPTENKESDILDHKIKSSLGTNFSHDKEPISFKMSDNINEHKTSDEPTSMLTKELQLDNIQQNLHQNTAMRMTEGENMEHKVNEKHDKFDTAVMRLAQKNEPENNLLNTMSEIHNEETKIKTDGSKNVQHDHPSTRKFQNQNSEMNLKEIENLPESLSNREETQTRDNLLQQFKVVSDFHNENVMPIKSIDMNKRQHNLNTHTGVRMSLDLGKDHQIQESQRSQDPFLMRWAHENQQRDFSSQPSQTKFGSQANTPAKINQFNNGQRLLKEHMDMRLNQDHKTSDNRDLQHPLLMHWAEENQQNDLSQLAKAAMELHNQQLTSINNGDLNHRQHLFDENNMELNQHQHMRNYIPEDHSLHDHLMSRLAQEKHNEHLHEVVPQNKFVNNFDLANTQDFSQHGHMNMMKNAMTSDMDNAMQPSMHMTMRDSMGQTGLEHNDMHWNHHHHHTMARFGSSLPVAGPGTVGVFPSANTGCGIPLMLSCSPSVVSGSLAKTHPAITAPAYRSGDDLMFYMKRDAQDNEDIPTIKIQKSSIPFNHRNEIIFDKLQ